MELTKLEQFLIKRWRELKPFESVTAIKDKDGKLTRCRVNTTQDIIVNEANIDKLLQ